jgi:hypothetical protein
MAEWGERAILALSLLTTPPFMFLSHRLLVLAGLLAVFAAPDLRAQPKTVCTITVNSADEREIFRKYLPPGDFQFVELVERGRPDWLASACRKGVQCDVLLISGHFDGGTEFYSDRLDAREFLPVDEMERVSCSDSCPGLFAKLKEVHLYGCNTLNGDAMRSASAEITRSLIRSGHAPADADALARVLGERHGESNRDRMRHIFKDVPVIYGFSSKAPLGAKAGPLLDRYFKAGAVSEVASGKPSQKLLNLFAPSSMIVTAGIAEGDPRSGFRQDVCRFSDERLTSAQKVGFVHQLLGRDMAEVRMFLDHIERYSTSLDDASRQAPDVAAELAVIAGDHATRDRYLTFARDADSPAVRVRMIELAHRLGWLTDSGRRVELLAMVSDQLAKDAVGSAEVDLVCTLNRDGALGRDFRPVSARGGSSLPASHAALVACLGDAAGHARVLQALTSPRDEDVQLAQVYLRHRPLADVNELRGVATGIARMAGSDAQVRALDTLARHQLSDRESLDELTRLFPLAKTVDVQRAIAGILIRSDYAAIAKPELLRALRQHRLRSPDGQDVIDVLVRRLQQP